MPIAERVRLGVNVKIGHPTQVNLKERIDSCDLGSVLHYDSVRVKLDPFTRDVNVISNLAVHDFSILDYVLGDHSVAVSPNGTKLGQRVVLRSNAATAERDRSQPFGYPPNPASREDKMRYAAQRDSFHA